MHLHHPKARVAVAKMKLTVSLGGGEEDQKEGQEEGKAREVDDEKTTTTFNLQIHPRPAKDKSRCGVAQDSVRWRRPTALATHVSNQQPL